MTTKAYIFNSIGIVMLIILSVFFLIMASFIYLGSVSSYVQNALTISSAFCVLLDLGSLVFIFKKNLRVALILALSANIIAFFYSGLYLHSINRDLLTEERATSDKMYRERLLVEYDKRVVCKDIGFYSEKYPWGGVSISTIVPEETRVRPQSIASFVIYPKSQQCKVFLPKPLDELNQCGEKELSEINRMIDDLKTALCPYPKRSEQ